MSQHDRRIHYISPQELAQNLGGTDRALLLDVRAPDELHGELGHVPNALNIPLNQLKERLSDLAGQEDHEVVVICGTGRRSEQAALILRDAGFKRVRVLSGGMLVCRSTPATQRFQFHRTS